MNSHLVMECNDVNCTKETYNNQNVIFLLKKRKAIVSV